MRRRHTASGGARVRGQAASFRSCVSSRAKWFRRHYTMPCDARLTGHRDGAYHAAHPWTAKSAMRTIVTTLCAVVMATACAGDTDTYELRLGHDQIDGHPYD